jgi:hypothetical protein
MEGGAFAAPLLQRGEEGEMKPIVLTMATIAVRLGGLCITATCKMQASDKKLAGATLTSFMKRCETDATKVCDADSKAKKLAGAAKSSHMKKCVSDAVGA